MRIPAFIFIFFMVNLLLGQSRNQVFESIRKADMIALADLFDKKIEYCFNDQIELLNKAAALKAIKAFLDRNVPKSITPTHQGSSKSEDSNFAIATMDCVNGRKFRIYIYAENTSGKLLVEELRIDVQK